MTPDENKVIPLPPDRRGPPAPVQSPPAYEPEQSLLGAILVRPEVFPAVIDAGVKTESFSGAAHGLIFKAGADRYTAEQNRASRLETMPFRDTKEGAQYLAGGVPGFKAPEALTAEQHGKNFDKWLGGSPYSTYDPNTKKVAFVPHDEGMARDVAAARNLALTHGAEPAQQHFEERQLARKYLQTQPLPPNFDFHAYLSAVSSDPKAWAEFMGKVRAPGALPGPAARPGFIDTEPGRVLTGQSPFTVGP